MAMKKINTSEDKTITLVIPETSRGKERAGRVSD